MKIQTKTFLFVTIIFTFLLASLAYTLVAQETEEYFFTLHLHSQREGTLEELIQQQLREIGINVVVEIVDSSSFWARATEGGSTGKTYEEGGYDIAQYGWGMGTKDPVGLNMMFMSSGRAPLGDNRMNFFNGFVDAELKIAGELLTWEEREPHYWKAMEIIYEEVPYVPLYYVENVDIMVKDLIMCDPWAGDGTGSPVASDKYDEEPLIEPSNWYFWGIRFWAREGKTYEDDTKVTVARTRDLQMLNPVFVSLSSANSEIHNVLYDGLTWFRYTWTKDQEWRLNLAESYQVSDDGMTYTFNLRDDVKWHDGVPFTSADVLCTFDAYMDPTTGAKGSLIIDTIESVEALDNYTVRFQLSWKDPSVWENVFTRDIIPAHIWGEIPHEEWLTSDYNTGVNTPIGTGPYKFGHWERDDYIQMDRYEDYHLCPIFFDHYIYKIFPGYDTAMIAIQAGTGECDIMGGNWQDRDIALENPETMKIGYSTPYYPRIILLNNENPYLNNKWVRKAISYVMPREHMVEDINHGLGYPANQILYEGNVGYNPNLPPIEYSIEKAMECMEKAGYDYSWLEPPPPPPETPFSEIAMYVAGGLIIGALIGGGIFYIQGRR